MATVVPVETRGTSPRYLGYLLQWYPWHHESGHDGGTGHRVGGVGGVKGSLVAPSSPRHQQTSYNSILCLFALLFRSSFEAVASVTNIICNSSTEAYHIVAARDAKRLEFSASALVMMLHHGRNRQD